MKLITSVVVLCCIFTKTHTLCTPGPSVVKCDFIADLAEYPLDESLKSLTIGDSLNNVANETWTPFLFAPYANLRELTIISRVNKMQSWAFFGMKNLTQLRLYNTSIGLISLVEMTGLSKLKTTDLQYNNIASKLRRLTSGAFKTQGLEEIRITHNQILHFGEPPIFPSDLLYLNIDHNNIEDIEDEVLNLPNLRELILSNNWFTKFLTQFKLKNLRTLDLSHNNIDIVGPGVFNEMPFLNLVYLNHNPLKQLPVQSFQRQKWNIMSLYLHKNRLENLQFLVENQWPDFREMSIAQNPLSCTCLFQLLKVFTHRAFEQTLCDQKYFSQSGNFPACVALDTDWMDGECRLKERDEKAFDEFFEAIHRFRC